MTDEVEEEPDLVEDAVTKKELIIARNPKDVQKMRLDKLMENPVIILNLQISRSIFANGRFCGLNCSSKRKHMGL